MAAASGLTMAITGAANWLGPVLAGVIGTYPVITTVVLNITHHQWSREAAVALLRGILFRWISFASCFLVSIGITLHEYGLAVLSSALGALAAAVTSGLVLALDRWAQRRSRPETRAPGLRARDLAEQDREGDDGRPMGDPAAELAARTVGGSRSSTGCVWPQPGSGRRPARAG